MSFDIIYSKIVEYSCITIFCHAHPDVDANGSQYGLFTWIKEHFPNKKVYIVADEVTSQGDFPKPKHVSDETIASSLAILLDIANPERINDTRYTLAKERIRIDHHPHVQSFAEIEYIDEKAAATCEILAQFFHQYQKKHPISVDTARYLYSGILTDTLCFKTNNTTSQTLQLASYLTLTGFDIAELNRSLFDIHLKDFSFGSFIREKVQIMNDSFAYCIVSIQEQIQWNKKGHDVRNFVTELGNVKEFQIWAIFTEKESENGSLYDGSLRSKTICINDIASQFKGGGHKNACGVKDLTQNELNDLLQQLANKTI